MAWEPIPRGLLDPERPFLKPLRTVLAPLSPVYARGMALRAALYAGGWLTSRRLARPVICVGNLTTGGSGKTPMVIKIAAELSRRGLRPAILSRGYRRPGEAQVRVVADTREILLDPREAGDEPYLMAQKLPGTPVVVGSDRFAAGQEALRRFDSDLLIMDDGFQHLRLRRDADILLVHGSEFGEDARCLPGGNLREAPAAAARADLIVLSGSASPEVLESRRRRAAQTPVHRAVFHTRHLRTVHDGEQRPASILKGKTVAAFAGIARPERFFASLQDAGARLSVRQSFPDHHPYTPAELDALQRDAQQEGADYLVTSEKDAVRLGDWRPPLPLLALELSVTVQDEDRFFNDLMGLTNTGAAH